MPAKAKSTKPTRSAVKAGPVASKKTAAKKSVSKKKVDTDPNQSRRLWLMFPQRLITTPVVYQLGNKFEVIPNIRQASVTDEIGIVCLELNGRREAIKSAIKWLEKQGITVEPVEINVIES